MSTRIYVVNDTRANPTRNRLVRASNRAQALRHVAQDAFVVDVASQNTLVYLLSQGVQVEDAGLPEAGDGGEAQ